jgi:hypothetical protein
MATWKDPKTYLYGLVAAVISGVGGAISLVVLDGDKFNPFGKGSWKSLLAAVIVQAMLAAGAYLRQSPIVANTNTPATPAAIPATGK